jgi:predicted Zn-ribbon and HTH transcriptional regulator
MIKKTYKCKNCGYEFAYEVFESKAEALKFTQEMGKSISPVLCHKCGCRQS